jgi:hypothetical protein
MLQITIGPEAATAIVLAIIGGCTWLSKSLLRVELAVKDIPKISARVHEIELEMASQDPHRRKRMRPLSRVLDEQQGGGDEEA